MAISVVPVARALYLCDYHIGSSNGKVDLYGLFNAIRPKNGFPHTIEQFCVFAQLTNGLGRIPFFVDVRFAEMDKVVRTTNTRELIFPSRNAVVHLALAVEKCTFERPGLYLVELFCDNTWVCDTQFLLQ